jgi:membrane protease YdiL (CAAX protease family)
MESTAAFRTGVASSILLTGVLFGLLHAPQLGWTFGLVSLLVFVGVIFTLARAWTGTVLASFLLHLGYNSFLAVTSIIATKGFTQMPPGS